MNVTQSLTLKVLMTVIISLSAAALVFVAFSDKKRSIGNSELAEISQMKIDTTSPLVEQKRQAIKTILVSKSLYQSNDWLKLLQYIEETNDPGELADFQSASGMTINEILSFIKEQDSDILQAPLYVIKAPFHNAIEQYDFLTEEFFFGNFYEPGLSILDEKFDDVWRIYTDEKTGSVNYLIGLESIVDGSRTVPALGTFGALLTKEGEWRALPVAAFRFE